MKKLISLALVLVLALALCACRKKADPPAEDKAGGGEKAVYDAPGARTARVLGTTLNSAAAPVRLVLNLPVGAGAAAAAPADVTVYIDGENIASRFDLAGYGRLGTLTRDGQSYVLWHDGETVLTGFDGGLTDRLGYLAKGYDEAYYGARAMTYTAGSETLNGTAYDYEELTDSGAVTRFYYDAGTDRLRYIRANDALVEIVEYDNAVDADVFELPNGYSTLDYQTFLSGLGSAANAENFGF